MRDREYGCFTWYLVSEPFAAYIRRWAAMKAVEKEAREFLALCREEIALNHDLDPAEESDEHLYQVLEEDRRGRALNCGLDPAITCWREIFRAEEEEDRRARALECGLDPETVTFAQIGAIEELRAHRVAACRLAVLANAPEGEGLYALLRLSSSWG